MKTRLLFLLPALLAVTTLSAQKTYIVEAEDFQFKGGWGEKGDPFLASGGKYLSVIGETSGVRAQDAFTVVDVEQAGTYAVWARGRDYPTAQPGTRLFRVAVNDKALETVLGCHGQEGFRWERAGQVQLAAGETMLALRDENTNYARVDAVLLTSDTEMNPNAISLEGFGKYLVKPKTMAVQSPPAVASRIQTLPAKYTELACAENGRIRTRFLEADGKIYIKTEYRKGDAWLSPDPQRADHTLGLLFSPDPQITFTAFLPYWNNSVANSTIRWSGGEKRFVDTHDAQNPYYAGNYSPCTVISAKKSAAGRVEAILSAVGGQTVSSVWEAAPGAGHMTVTLSCKADREGCYSFAFDAFTPTPREKMRQVLLPPMIQAQRVPEQVAMQPGALVTQQVAIVESTAGTGYVAGAIGMYPLQWGSARESRFGFSILNAAGGIQPVAFSPVLGLADSKLSKGQQLERVFEIGINGEGAESALDYVSTHIFRVRDYRGQKEASLTEAALNMTDLINDDEHSGYDPKLKAFYDIEAHPILAPTGGQSAPLAIVESAVLMQDEDFYIRRALPTIEYTLSRYGYRYALKGEGERFLAQVKTLELGPYDSQFGTPYYEGLHKLLGGANQWFYELTMPGGVPRTGKAFSSSTLSWVNEMGAYRLTGEKKWLDSAVKKAKAYIDKEVYGTSTKQQLISAFYNVSFYPQWWQLLDIYEVTKDKTFLDAAVKSAYQTIAGVRSYPQVENKTQQVNAGVADPKSTPHLWWKGMEKYRLGYPVKPGEVQVHDVPESLVSPVGLGFEQPFTYFSASGQLKNVYMSSWAPHLLKLYQYEPRPIFEIYARNAVIGRFTNYPGYYATVFSDITSHRGFPLKGPDISGIYYHHIPPHLAFTWDFVITEAIQRSGGRIDFPYSKQEGFVWFNNRVYGVGAGNILGYKNVKLWIKRGLVVPDRPEINYISGRSGDTFLVVLMNEDSLRVDYNLRIGDEVQWNGKQATLYQSVTDKKTSTVPGQDRVLRLSIPGRGMQVVALPVATQKKTEPLPPVRDGFVKVALPDGLGNFYLFRIRSPFGWDSFYGYLGTGPVEGLSASLSLVGGEAKTIDAYPYEFTFIRADATKAATLELKLLRDGKPLPKSYTLEMPVYTVK